MLTPPVGKRDHILGSPDADIVLVEYGDYECPFCAQARPFVAQIRAALQDSLLFAFRNFPLAQAHPHAESAAEAAEAAGAQGKFWEMHDLLYDHQDALDNESLVEYAAALELDRRRFVAALAEHTYLPRIREDFLSGTRSGVNGTPSFFVNGVRYDGPRDVQAFLAALESAPT